MVASDNSPCLLILALCRARALALPDQQAMFCLVPYGCEIAVTNLWYLFPKEQGYVSLPDAYSF